MQNVTQTVRFPVSSIIPTKLPDDIQALLIKTRQAKRAIEGLSSIVAAEAELNELAGPKIQKDIATFGASSLADDINLSMQLGTVLFDIYTRMTPEPQAPLAKLVWRKKITELAEVFGAEEFELPQHAIEPIKRALSDESVWQNLSLTVWVELPLKEGETEAKRHYFTINTQGVVYFTKVLEAAAELVYSEDLKVTK